MSVPLSVSVQQKCLMTTMIICRIMQEGVLGPLTGVVLRLLPF